MRDIPPDDIPTEQVSAAASQSSDESTLESTALSRRRVLMLGATLASGLALGQVSMGCPAPTTEHSPDAEGGLPDVHVEHTVDTESSEPAPPEEFYEDPPKGKITTFAPDSLTEDRTAFPMGVQAGAMRVNSAILWTFVAGLSDVTLKVWRETATPGTVEMFDDTTVTPDDAGYCKHTTQGLQAGAWYQYAFVKDQKRSPIGQFRSALAPGVKEPLKIGATTCTNHKYHPSFTSLQMLAKEKPDVFLHLGDMSYNDAAKDLDSYRKIWRETINDVGYQAILPAAGMYITWDDHEVDNDWEGEGIEATRLKAARQAFFETLPVERGPNDKLWNSYRWGDTAEIFVMDCRSERQPTTRTTDKPIYISQEQIKWLKDGLSQSRAHFKILMNSVPITQMPQIWLNQEDRWQGYAKQREELLDFIVDNKITNVWFVAGDFHVGFVSQVEPEGKWSQLMEIAVGPGASGVNPLGNSELAMPSAQFPFHSSKNQVMTTLAFDPKGDQVHVRFVDATDNKVLFDQKLTQKKS